MKARSESPPASDSVLPYLYSADEGRCALQSPIGRRLRTTRDICQTFLDDVVPRLACHLGQVWGLDPVRRKLTLLATSGIDEPAARFRVLDCAKHLTGQTVERKRTTLHPDARVPDEEGRRFSQPQLIDEQDLRQMVSVPVLNTCNPNQVLAVVNLFPGQHFELAENELLESWAARLARQIETNLNQRCIRSAQRLQIELGKVTGRTKENVCRPLARLVRQETACDLVSVFLETTDRQNIRIYASDGTPWVDEPEKPPATSLERQTWTQNREHLSLDLAGEGCGLVVQQSAKHVDEAFTGVFVPLRDLSGRAKGVVRCVNRCRDENALRPFTYDDVALIESMGQVFVPQLEFLLAEQARIDMLSKLAHEMRVPVTAFKAAVQAVEAECDAADMHFKWDHFEELNIYSDLMARLLTQLDLVRLGPYRVPLNPRRTNLLSSIIAPAKRFTRALCSQKGLSQDQIRYHGLDRVPKLWVDPGLMTQVVFNLMENAIKYSKDDPADFRLEINAEVSTDFVDLVFRDRGIGVPVGFEQRIFDGAERGPTSHLLDVAGEGLGLWIAREIVSRHDGTLILSSQQDPTEFVLRLPRYLEDEPPRDKTPEEERS